MTVRDRNKQVRRNDRKAKASARKKRISKTKEMKAWLAGMALPAVLDTSGSLKDVLDRYITANGTMDL